MDIGIERTYDPVLVRMVMTFPGIWEHVSDDSMEPDDFWPDVEEQYWLISTAGNDVTGAFQFCARNDATLEVHCGVLPRHRSKYARKAAIAALQWVLDHSHDEYVKIVAEVPVIHSHIVRFLKNLGFQQEGINRMSSRNHGKVCDQILLGITRQELASFLQGPN